jgi:hypothetical protein
VASLDSYRIKAPRKRIRFNLQGSSVAVCHALLLLVAMGVYSWLPLYYHNRYEIQELLFTELMLILFYDFNE